MKRLNILKTSKNILLLLESTFHWTPEHRRLKPPSQSWKLEQTTHSNQGIFKAKTASAESLGGPKSVRPPVTPMSQWIPSGMCGVKKKVGGDLLY